MNSFFYPGGARRRGQVRGRPCERPGRGQDRGQVDDLWRPAVPGRHPKPDRGHRRRARHSSQGHRKPAAHVVRRTGENNTVYYGVIWCSTVTSYYQQLMW